MEKKQQGTRCSLRRPTLSAGGTTRAPVRGDLYSLASGSKRTRNENEDNHGGDKDWDAEVGETVYFLFDPLDESVRCEFVQGRLICVLYDDYGSAFGDVHLDEDGSICVDFDDGKEPFLLRKGDEYNFPVVAVNDNASRKVSKQRRHDTQNGGRVVLTLNGLEAVSEIGENDYAPSRLSPGRAPPAGASECLALEVGLRDFIRGGHRVADCIYDFIVMAMALVAAGKIKGGDVVRWRDASDVKVNAQARNKEGKGISNGEALKAVMSQIDSRVEQPDSTHVDVICFAATPQALQAAMEDLSLVEDGVWMQEKGVIGKGYHPLSWARSCELNEMIRVLDVSLRSIGRSDGAEISVKPTDFFGYTRSSIPPEEIWGFLGNDNCLYPTREDCSSATGDKGKSVVRQYSGM